MPKRLLIATGNRHKANEIEAILIPLLPVGEFELICLADIGIGSPPPEIEKYDTFEANAAAKALWCRDRCHFACVADDSGLCVAALNGAPGVWSARWAGPTDADRNAALLAELDRVNARTPADRGAKFVCAAAYAPEHGPVVTVLGEVHGRIVAELSGTAGFGYDPLFFCPELGATFAEAGAAGKNAVSHRAKALRMLISQSGRFVS